MCTKRVSTRFFAFGNGNSINTSNSSNNNNNNMPNSSQSVYTPGPPTPLLSNSNSDQSKNDNSSSSTPPAPGAAAASSFLFTTAGVRNPDPGTVLDKVVCSSSDENYNFYLINQQVRTRMMIFIIRLLVVQQHRHILLLDMIVRVSQLMLFKI
jgi:hypothetical protein